MENTNSNTTVNKGTKYYAVTTINGRMSGWEIVGEGNTAESALKDGQTRIYGKEFWSVKFSNLNVVPESGLVKFFGKGNSGCQPKVDIAIEAFQDAKYLEEEMKKRFEEMKKEFEEE